MIKLHIRNADDANDGSKQCMCCKFAYKNATCYTCFKKRFARFKNDINI